MKKKILAAIVLATVVSLPAHAISSKFRHALEWSGCTQQTEADGSCNIKKPKAWNEAHMGASHHSLSTDAHQEPLPLFLRHEVIGQSVDDAYRALGDRGFENTEPDTWANGAVTVLLNVHNEVVLSARTIRK